LCKFNSYPGVYASIADLRDKPFLL
jgi:hypothetical protein